MDNESARIWFEVDRHGERLGSHEGRLVGLERSRDNQATRGDVADIKELLGEIRTDLRDLRCSDRDADRAIGSLRDRVGKLEGGSNGRGAAAGLGGGALLLLLAILARLLGVEIPMP